MENEIKERVAASLIKAVQDALRDGPKLLPLVIAERADDIETMISTIARLEYLKVTILKSFCETSRLKPHFAKGISEDVIRTMIVMLASSKSLTKEELAGFYSADFLGKILDFVDKEGPGEKKSNPVLERALSTLKETAERTNTP